MDLYVETVAIEETMYRLQKTFERRQETKKTNKQKNNKKLNLLFTY